MLLPEPLSLSVGLCVVDIPCGVYDSLDESYQVCNEVTDTCDIVYPIFNDGFDMGNPSRQEKKRAFQNLLINNE